MSDVHAAAREGFTQEAQTYTRGRPDYPAQLSQWLRGQLALEAGATVVDLGAGTGKFTRLLSATGARVIAVEPVAAMRAQLIRALPDIAVLGGTAQAIPLAGGAAQALVCAQAFHWFATHAALAEIQRVLAPAGRLGLIWNVRDESVDWVAAITAIIAPYEGGTPRFHSGQWRQARQSTQVTLTLVSPRPAPAALTARVAGVVVCTANVQYSVHSMCDGVELDGYHIHGTAQQRQGFF